MLLWDIDDYGFLQKKKKKFESVIHIAKIFLFNSNQPA